MSQESSASRRKSHPIKCPNCDRGTVYGPENAWRPFCSERCKLIDLGQWATEKYRIPVEEQDPGLDVPDA